MPMTAAVHIVFKHMIELKSSGCVFCYTQEEDTGRSRIFLIFKEKLRVYARNGLQGTWEEVQDSDVITNVLNAYEKAVHDQRVPYFSTTISDLEYV